MATTAREAARQIIERLPDQATWDELMYELYVKQKIKAGLADVRGIHGARDLNHERVPEVCFVPGLLQLPKNLDGQPGYLRGHVRGLLRSVAA